MYTLHAYDKVFLHTSHAMTACISGTEYILASGKTVGNVMLQACKDDHDEDALDLLHVVKMQFSSY